jgi:hypothetical protein
LPESISREAAALAEHTAQSIKTQGIEAAFPAFDDALSQFEQAGYRVADVLPRATSERLGLVRRNAPRPDGRTFWEHYKEVVCDELCREKKELNTLVRRAASGAPAPLVAWILTTLGLPVAAALIAATIAGILVALGVDAFCRYRGF